MLAKKKRGVLMYQTEYTKLRLHHSLLFHESAFRHVYSHFAFFAMTNMMKN